MAWDSTEEVEKLDGIAAQERQGGVSRAARLTQGDSVGSGNKMLEASTSSALSTLSTLLTDASFSYTSTLEDDEAYFEDCESDPNSRFVDYSCATSWEYFITDAEELLRRWVSEPWDTGTDASGMSRSHRQETLELEDRKYRFVLWRGKQMSASTATGDLQGPPALEDTSIDFDGRLDRLQRFFGLRAFLVVWRVRDGDEGMGSSEASMILSSLSIALHNCGYGLPVLVPVGRKANRSASGMSRPFGGFDDMDVIRGYAVPSPPEHQLVPTTTRLESSRILQPSETFKTLEGFMDLLLNRVQDAGGPGVWPAEGVGNGAGMGGFSGKLLVGGELRPKIVVNAEHTWLWEARGFDWMLPTDEWRTAAAAEREKKRTSGRDRAARRVIHSLFALEPGGSRSLGLQSLRLKGPDDDPLVSLCLRVRWRGLEEGSFVDNAFYSTLQALQVDLSGWHISAAFNDPASRASSLPASPLSPRLIGLLDGVTYPPTAEVAPLATLLRSLLASYITAKAVSAGTMMMELATLISGSADGESEVEKEVTTQAVAIASHLGPSMSAHVKELSLRPHPTSKAISTIVTAVMEGGGDSTTVGEEEEEGGGHSSLQGRHKDVMRVPVGRLVSLLAVAFGGLETLAGMAALWVDVVKELRWRWDQGQRIPGMKVWSLLDGARPHTDSVVGLSMCLLHQKLQILDRCIERRCQDRSEAARLPASDTSAATSTTEELASPMVSAVSTPARQKSEEQQQEPSPPPSESPSDGWGLSEQEEVFFDSLDQAREVEKSTGASGSIGLCMFGRGREDVEILAPQVLEPCPMSEESVLQVRQLQARLAAAPSTSSGETRKAFGYFLPAPKLASDMCAFKAANPGCVLADFLRWRCPEVWVDDIYITVPDEGTEEAATEEQGSVEQEDAAADSVEDEQTRLVWEGRGFVRQSMVGKVLEVGLEEVKKLWIDAKGCPASEQKPLFNVAQEAEKVLHYLETVSPAHLLCQVLAAAFCTIQFMLHEAPTEAVDLQLVQSSHKIFDELVEEALELLHEEQMSSETVLLGGELAQPVSQKALTACDAVCRAVAAVEERLAKATALLHRLPSQHRLVESLISMSTPVSLSSEAERRAVLRVFGSPTETKDKDKDDKPKEANAEANAAPAATTTDNGDRDKGIESGAEDDAMNASERGRDGTPTKASQSSSPSSPPQTPPQLPGAEKKESVSDDAAQRTSNSSYSSTSGVVYVSPSKGGAGPHYALPQPGVRTYVLRHKVPSPFHHPPQPSCVSGGRLEGGPPPSPPVTTRLYAQVNKAEDSVRLAIALSEAEV